MKGAVASRALAACLVLALASCGSTPPAPVTGTARQDDQPLARTDAPTAFELRQRDRALAATRQGRLAEATLAWEILTVLRPDAGEYRERLADARARAETAASDHLARGAQADRRGDNDIAMQHYLAVMALQPDNTQAADRLRAIERERIKRNFLGKYSRITLTRRAVSDAEAQPAAPAAIAAGEGGELEHASLLAAQGESADAIVLLERRLARQKNDSAAARLLADLYVQRAQALGGSDTPAAVKALERAVRLDPSNAQAAARLKELRSPRSGPASAVSAGRR